MQIPFEPLRIPPAGSAFPIGVMIPRQPGIPTTDPGTLLRLDMHLSSLKTAGVNDLSKLGTLTLRGAVVPSVGVLVPGTLSTPHDDFRELPGVLTMYSNVRAIGLSGTALAEIGGRAVQLSSVRLQTPTHGLQQTAIRKGRFLKTGSPQIHLEVAYLAATRIELLDDTLVIIRDPVKYLVLIADTIVVGQRVSFSWEPLRVDVPPSPNAAEAQPQPPKSTSLEGVNGQTGAPGLSGSTGWEGNAAPQLEVWALTMQGKPAIDLHGQDGGTGGSGGQGGAGGPGSEGRDEMYDFLGFCASGAGSGGDGGYGGSGGSGGSGGNGGDGGTFSFYSTPETLLPFAAGFTADCSGGAGGRGGVGGSGGAGGPGGPVGAHPKNCQPGPGRLIQDGQAGQPGATGIVGLPGKPGAISPNAMRMHVITREDFNRKLQAPAIFTVTPAKAHAGQPLTIQGARFTPSDIVLIDSAVVSASVISQSVATCTVPMMPMGNHMLQVRQSDGTLSNPFVFLIVPSIEEVIPSVNVRPGSLVRIKGSGFSPTIRVLVEGQNVPAVSVLSTQDIEFTLHRPPTPRLSTAKDEVVTIEVAVPTGERSNSVEVTLDTLRIVIIGDSVACGQGLVPQQKMHTLVANQLRQNRGNIGVQTVMLAHSGATIGVGDSTVLPSIDGEVPTSYPTALQQVEMFNDAPASVDYVFIAAGINDVNVRNILNPTVSEATLSTLIRQHCLADVKTLLAETTKKFSSATIVVCGYYPLIGEETDLGLLAALLTGLGLSVASIPGAIVGGVASIWLKEQLVHRSQMFNRLSSRHLQQAVNEVNISLINDRTESSHRITFAAPEFEKSNSALSSAPWLYGIDINLNPQDHQVAGGRASACVAAGSDRTNVEVCKRASIGHPNERGAAAYADEILVSLRRQEFPQDFLWGVATAGKQVEGNITGDDWEIFTTNPKIVARVNILPALAGQPALNLWPAGVAVMHSDLNVLKADLDRAKALGCNAYRMSIEWSRVEPAATGGFNLAALEYYDRAIDLLVQRGMKPIVTLNHLTLPAWVLTPSSSFPPEPVMPDDAFLSSLMGWENPVSVARFIAYVAFVVARYKSKVDTWITLNEPVGSMIGVGYLAGVWPPGFVASGGRAKTAYFNLLKAHVGAYDAIKVVYGAAPSFVSFAHNMMHTKLSLDGGGLGNIHEAAKNQFDYFYNWHFLDALMSGTVDTEIAHRPSDQVRVPASTFYGIPSGSAWLPRLDFVGLNYYRSVYVGHDAGLALTAPYTGGGFDNNLLDEPRVTNFVNHLGWEVYPKGLLIWLRRLHTAYGLPIMITENGLPDPDDTNRASFLVAHLRAIEQALAEGIHVSGYLHWSLVDNWEWQENYASKARFGLFTVDRNTTASDGSLLLSRHITDAALALRFIISSGSVAEAEERFGSISALGDTILYPSRMKGSLWEGTTSDGRNVTLWMALCRNGQQVTGLLCFSDVQSWHAISGHKTAGSTFRINMPDGAGHSIVAQIDLSAKVLQWQAGLLLFSLTRSPLHGAWFTSGTDFVSCLEFSQLEGAVRNPSGRLSMSGGNRKWHPATPSSAAGAGSFAVSGTAVSFGGTITPTTGDLSATITLPGSAPITWTARRLKADEG